MNKLFFVLAISLSVSQAADSSVPTDEVLGKDGVIEKEVMTETEPMALKLGPGCSEALCGPRVSKCMLLKSCNCTITPAHIRGNTCTCCKDCIRCLSEQYSDCCSCVGLCRGKPVQPSLAIKSYVEDLDPDDDEQALFEMVFKDMADGEQRFVPHTFPALQDSLFYHNTSLAQLAESDRSLEMWANTNCTVLYINNCLSVDKCRSYCSTTGASSYRWFHTGCCECVGAACLNYGSRENLCTNCADPDAPPPPKNEL